MAGFTKLFSSIVTSSIWREDNVTRIVWVTMLALSDAKGHVDAALPGLAAAANVDLDECERAVVKLESPDRYSRTSDFEGRRIAKEEGGWRILNYAYYREKGRAQDRTEYMREYQKNRRRRKQCQPLSTIVNQSKPIAEAEAEAEKNTTTTTAREEIAAGLRFLLPLWNRNCREKHRLTESTPAIDRLYSGLVFGAPPIGRDEIAGAIENYGAALRLADTQAGDFSFGCFLRDLRDEKNGTGKYLAGVFNLGNFSKGNFRKDKSDGNGSTNRRDRDINAQTSNIGIVIQA